MQEQSNIPFGMCQCGCGQPSGVYRFTDPRDNAVKGSPRRFIVGHHKRKSPVDYVINQSSGCWEWQLCLSEDGYGILRRDGETKAHRVFYQRAHGDIPDGLEIDHLCKNRRCVNPGHLDAVSHTENIRRGHWASKTHCAKGHPFDEQNTAVHVRKNGHRNRICKACKADYQRTPRGKELLKQSQARYMARKRSSASQ